MVLIYTLFTLLHQSDGGEVLFRLCNRTDHAQAEGALGGHALCFVGPPVVAGRPRPAGMSKSGREGRRAEGALPRKVPPSPPHPPPNALLWRQVSTNQANTDRRHPHTFQEGSHVCWARSPCLPPREVGCSLDPGVAWVRKEPACPQAEGTDCRLYPSGRPN